MAKIEFRGRGLLLTIVLIGLAVPFQVPSLPLFLGLAQFAVLDSYFSLMFPLFVSVFAIFLMRQFIKAFPDEIIAPARLRRAAGGGTKNDVGGSYLSGSPLALAARPESTWVRVRLEPG